MLAFKTHREFALQLDKEDDLKHFRDQFYIPKKKDGSDAVYLLGNSLGLEPKKTQEYVIQELDDWKKLDVEDQLHGRNQWRNYHELVSDSLARLLCAKPTEVIAMNSLTINLHLMLVSFYRPTATRYKILMEGGAFPADQYAVKSQLKLHGQDENSALIEVSPGAGEYCIDENKLLETIEKHGHEIALILIGAVNFRTGQLFDIQKITELGHQKGCMVGIDAAHAIGNVELKLHDWNVDFAVWCNYKYLNAGPGAIGGAFIHEKHVTDKNLMRFAGWWGHNKKTRFDMPAGFDPIPTAEGWQVSNPPILQLACLRAALNIFDHVDSKKRLEKSAKLTAYLTFLLETHFSNQLEIITPNYPKRGAQLSFRLPGASQDFVTNLLAHGYYCDFRPPHLIRTTPVPLYTQFIDVFNFVECLRNFT